MKRVTSVKIYSGFLCLLIAGALLAPSVQAATLKKIVAVSRFENKSNWKGQWDLDNGMADQLTNALVQSGQFVVLERQTLEDVLSEQNLAASGMAQKSSTARAGKLTSAQMLVKGTITEFEEASSGGGGGIRVLGVGVGGAKKTAHVGMTIRLIDTTTGQVLYSERVEGKAESESVSGSVDLGAVSFGGDAFHKTPLGKAVQQAIDNCVEIITSKMQGIPFKASIIKAEGSEVFIAAGKQSGVSPGDTFSAYKLGEELVDPDTGELLGADETKIGTVQVFDVKDKYSKAKVLSGSGYEKGQIVRSE